MSEYQYYEFLAIDRPLTPKQIAEIERFGTCATITATRFANEYHWGDFRGEPKKGHGEIFRRDGVLRQLGNSAVYVSRSPQSGGAETLETGVPIISMLDVRLV